MRSALILYPLFALICDGYVESHVLYSCEGNATPHGYLLVGVGRVFMGEDAPVHAARLRRAPSAPRCAPVLLAPATAAGPTVSPSHSTSRSVRLTGADLRAQVSESTLHDGAADRSIVFRYDILPIATAARVRVTSSHSHDVPLARARS